MAQSTRYETPATGFLVFSHGQFGYVRNDLQTSQFQRDDLLSLNVKRSYGVVVGVGNVELAARSRNAGGLVKAGFAGPSVPEPDLAIACDGS